MLGIKTLTITFLMGLMALAMPPKTLAQNSAQDYLDAHNTGRSGVGVSAVTWSTTVQAYAQNYANARQSDCLLTPSKGPYGENLFKGSSTSTGVNAVNAWLAEKQYYTYGTNTCATGHICSHYTQVVWKNSTEIGCARVVCANNVSVFVICSYNPCGNTVGFPY